MIEWWASRKLAVKSCKFCVFLSRETRDLHVGLHGSQRLPAQRPLPPDRRTVETTLGHTVSQASRLYGFLLIISHDKLFFFLFLYVYIFFLAILKKEKNISFQRKKHSNCENFNQRLGKLLDYWT